MTDKELLELAAKAAGIEGEYGDTVYGGIGIQQKSVTRKASDVYCSTHPGQYDNTTLIHIPKAWNPLTDDGDALRLAVKLNMYAEFGGNSVLVKAPSAPPLISKHDAYPCDGDAYAATRRAIVRAAAEIGRAMP